MVMDKITKERAKEIILFNEEGMAHTFYNLPMGLVGADHPKESLFEDIDKAVECKKTGEKALAMRHGLAIIPNEPYNQSDILFVETKDSFNEEELKQLKKEGEKGE